MVDWWRETRVVLRSCRRTPSLPIAVAATLTLALGLTSAVFAFADGYLFRPLPFPSADRIYTVAASGEGLRQTDTELLRHSSAATWGFVEWTASRRIHGFRIRLGERRVDFYAEGVTPGFAKTIAVPLLAGRDFTDDDHRAGDTVPVWLSHWFWQKELGGDRTVIGREFVTDASPPQRVVVVGILAPAVSSFNGQNEPPAAIAAELVPIAPNPGWRSNPFVRLPNGITPQQAAAVIANTLNSASVAAGGLRRTIQLRSLLDRQVKGGRPTAVVLFAGAMLVMFLALITIVQSLLAHGVARNHEIATRAALGATRWRLARLFLTEALVLGVAGSGGGLLLGAWLAHVIQSRIPPFPTSGRNLTLVPMLFDFRVVAFTVVLGVIVPCAAMLWPLRRALSGSLTRVSRGSAGSTTAIPMRLSRVMLASEFAVATVVITGTVFIGSGIWRYLHQPLGFDYSHRYWMTVFKTDATALTADERESARRAFVQAPRVKAVGFDSVTDAGDLEVIGRSMDRQVTTRAVPRGYYEAWQLRLQMGRWFSETEFAGQEPVAVVDEALASTAWPLGDALGQELRVGGVLRRVIGVIEPKRASLTRAPPGQAYVPATGREDLASAVVWAPYASSTELAEIAAAAGRAVAGSRVEIRPVTLKWLFMRETGEAEFQGPIMVMFGALGLALAAVGVFGLVSYLVERRLHEFGIRRALGAQGLDIWKYVVWQTVAPALAGVALGLVLAHALETIVRSSIFGWPSSAPLAIVAAATILMAVAVLAAIGPALRAVRMDPARTLRMD